MKYKKSLLVGSSLFFLLGCTEKSLTKIRQIDIESESRTALHRGYNVRYNDTIYSEPLRIYGKELRVFLKTNLNWNDKDLARLKIGIDDIHDKTGKVYSTNAISDMVFAAMAKLNVFALNNVRSPNRRNNLEIMENLTYSKKDKKTGKLLSGFNIAETVKKKPSTLYYLPSGVVKPSRFYISGGLLEYDKKRKEKVGLDIKYASFGTNLDVIDVSLDLRLIDSLDGTLAVTEKTKIPAFVSLTNRLVTISRDGEYFKVINSDPFGIKVSSNIGDPTFYAVREVVELAILEIFTRFTGFKWKNSSAPKFIGEKGTFSQFVIKKDK